MTTAPSPRGAQTRALIVETALRLFRERGYERTTMRGIAAEAGVSVGNAYYYFASKEHLVQAFYDRTQDEHLAVARPALAGLTAFDDRLRAALDTRIDTIAPYKQFAGSFFATAADPTSPLSPFSAESAPAREAAVGLYREVVEGSDLAVPADLAPDLPELLWLYQMGVVLFWVHDPTPDAARTRLLVARTVPMVATLLRLARLRVLRPVLRDLVGLLRELRGPV